MRLDTERRGKGLHDSASEAGRANPSDGDLEDLIGPVPACEVDSIVTPKTGPAVIDYYDKVTGLLVRREDAEQGMEASYQLFSDHRKVDGIVHAFTTKIVNGPTEILVTIDHIEHNVALPEERFAMPAELKKQPATLE